LSLPDFDRRIVNAFEHAMKGCMRFSPATSRQDLPQPAANLPSGRITFRLHHLFRVGRVAGLHASC
jgi:hypothetical protein